MHMHLGRMHGDITLFVLRLDGQYKFDSATGTQQVPQLALRARDAHLPSVLLEDPLDGRRLGPGQQGGDAVAADGEGADGQRQLEVAVGPDRSESSHGRASADRLESVDVVECGDLGRTGDRAALGQC